MYEAFYGLCDKPFDLTPNPQPLRVTPGHQDALEVREARSGLPIHNPLEGV